MPIISIRFLLLNPFGRFPDTNQSCPAQTRITTDRHPVYSAPWWTGQIVGEFEKNETSNMLELEDMKPAESEWEEQFILVLKRKTRFDAQWFTGSVVLL